MSLQTQLAALESEKVQRNKASGYSTLLDQSVQTQNTDNVIAIVSDAATKDHVGIVIGRQVIAELVKALEEKKITSEEKRRLIIEKTLEILQPRTVSYEEQVRSFII
jgi:COP9 signalosome complex subunit 4